MKIGIDVSAAAGKKLSGVGYHIINLVSELDIIINSDDQLILFYEGGDGRNKKNLIARFPNKLIKSKIVCLPFFTTNLGTLHRIKNRYLWYILTKIYRCDIFHGMAHTTPANLPCQSIVTIHDLAFFEFELYEKSFSTTLREKVYKSVKQAEAVICLSKNTKKDLEKYIGNHKHVEVIYGAGNFASDTENSDTNHGSSQLKEKYGIDSKYLLYVGDFGPRKNLPYLIQAFSTYKKQYNDNKTQLVMVGDCSEAENKLRNVAIENDINDALLTTGRISTPDLKLLYKNAHAFTLPSLAEGFGMVLLEAMSYGLPVIATNTSCIEEAVGNAAILIELDNIDQYSKAINEALNEESKRNSLIEAGKKQVSLFSWKKSAEATNKLYCSLLK